MNVLPLIFRSLLDLPPAQNGYHHHTPQHPSSPHHSQPSHSPTHVPSGKKMPQQDSRTSPAPPPMSNSAATSALAASAAAASVAVQLKTNLRVVIPGSGNDAGGAADVRNT